MLNLLGNIISQGVRSSKPRVPAMG